MFQKQNQATSMDTMPDCRHYFFLTLGPGLSSCRGDSQGRGCRESLEGADDCGHPAALQEHL